MMPLKPTSLHYNLSAPSSNFPSNIISHGSNTKSAYPTVRMQTRVHRLIEDQGIVLMPGCYDALSAAIVEKSGSTPVLSPATLSPPLSSANPTLAC
ncbi:hypothetical protein Patl1_08175 [Pistacia atlantica]|uniref:Uncharacterized protein n=1 Tax=Pistacia atlantica TaxID=434234 RepID=A0ACC1AL27_9ROSI|nr:hypothetical protein Patl1_08175 [Pistacia atlantica]